MRSPRSSSPAPASRAPKLWLAVGAIGVALATAVLGVTAAAQADGSTPNPTNSDDASYQAGASTESAPSVQFSDGKDANSARPADLAPDEVKRFADQAKKQSGR